MPYPAHLLQAVVATATASTDASPLAGHLVQGAVALILALQAWVIRAVTSTRDEVRTIRQALFGVNNDNGIDGAVKAHEHRLTECEGYIERTVPERLKLWGAFKEATERALEELRSSIHKVRNMVSEVILDHRARLERLEKDRDQRNEDERNERRNGLPDRRQHP
jgi:hypothetical protein